MFTSVKSKIETRLLETVEELGLPKIQSSLTHPTDLHYGDYASNISLLLAKKLGKNSKELAETISTQFNKKPLDEVLKVEIAGLGFINFYLKREFFAASLKNIISDGNTFGKSKLFMNQKVMVEYTDPNPFKEFHIGHLMANAIGEPLANLFEWSGAEVKRACYQGDIGIHVASAIWGMQALESEMPRSDGPLSEKAAFLGKAYAKGAGNYKSDPLVADSIKDINKKIFDRSDEELNALYDLGKTWSLQYFENIYNRLGTKFDFYFFESETGREGIELVRQALRKGIFEESEGAIIFRGEPYGLHTRVFINAQGLPTYEAKDLALPSLKYERYPYDLSVVITGNEVNDYFKVLFKVLSLLVPSLAKKTKHIGHGMLRLPGGKMSSRTGEVITAETLIANVADIIRSKMKNEAITHEEKEEIVEVVAIGAIKFAILKQAIGKDTIFDFEKSLSFDGDSGPYLLYSAVRAQSLIAKAQLEELKAEVTSFPEELIGLERLLYRFPEIVERAAREKAPHLIVSYLLEIAAAFNTFYAGTKILGGTKSAGYRLALTQAFLFVINNGLSILGIKVPEKM